MTANFDERQSGYEAGYEAGRASREGEVEALKAERNEYKGRMQRLMTTGLELRKEIEGLRAERDCAIGMLAEWCVDVDMGGSGWDYWDEHYKTAMYRPNPIRSLLDQAIDEARKEK